MRRRSQTQIRKKCAKRRRKLEAKKKAALALALNLKVGKELDDELERQELRRRLGGGSSG